MKREPKKSPLVPALPRIQYPLFDIQKRFSQSLSLVINDMNQPPLLPDKHSMRPIISRDSKDGVEEVIDDGLDAHCGLFLIFLRQKYLVFDFVYVRKAVIFIVRDSPCAKGPR